MNDILRDLLLNGFMIYPDSNGKYMMRKEAVPSNQNIIEETQFDNYDLAVDAAASLIYAPKIKNWTAIVRYNRGLGIEYRNLSDIQSTNKDDAQKIAENMAEKVLAADNTIILEVRVSFKN